MQTDEQRHAVASTALKRLRAETGALHERLEARVNAVPRLADPILRRDMIRRYAALHLPLEAAVAPWLSGLHGLDFGARRRRGLAAHAGAGQAAAVPELSGVAGALGVMYVLEGSTLGGRLIMRELAERGVDDPALGFLDPYGPETGTMWRAYLAVLLREVGEDAASLDAAAAGAVMAFGVAEDVLCGPGA